MKRNLLASAAAAICFALWATNTSAQTGYQNGAILRVYGGQQLGSKIVFRLDSGYQGVARGNIPACSVYSDEWALDLTTDSGRIAYGVVQDAQRNKIYLQVYGTGTCRIMGDREDVLFLYSCYPGFCSP